MPEQARIFSHQKCSTNPPGSSSSNTTTSINRPIPQQQYLPFNHTRRSVFIDCAYLSSTHPILPLPVTTCIANFNPNTSSPTSPQPHRIQYSRQHTNHTERETSFDTAAASAPKPPHIYNDEQTLYIESSTDYGFVVPTWKRIFWR